MILGQERATMRFLSWIAQNWQIVLAWITGLTALWRVGKVLTGFVLSITDVFARFAKAESTLGLLATNHLPHLQAEMEKMNEGIADLQICSDKSNEIQSGIREDLRVVLDRL
jgi:hypothetical protein